MHFCGVGQALLLRQQLPRALEQAAGAGRSSQPGKPGPLLQARLQGEGSGR